MLQGRTSSLNSHVAHTWRVGVANCKCALQLVKPGLCRGSNVHMPAALAAGRQADLPAASRLNEREPLIRPRSGPMNWPRPLVVPAESCIGTRTGCLSAPGRPAAAAPLPLPLPALTAPSLLSGEVPGDVPANDGSSLSTRPPPAFRDLLCRSSRKTESAAHGGQHRQGLAELQKGLQDRLCTYDPRSGSRPIPAYCAKPACVGAALRTYCQQQAPQHAADDATDERCVAAAAAAARPVRKQGAAG